MAAASQPYDQRDGYIWLNGELIPWRDARVHMLTHALHYGSAVFEGERVYDGEIFKLTEHSQRLLESAKGLDFEIPYTVAEIDQACRDVVRANKLVDGYVRPLAWRGSEQMGVSAQATRINLAVAAWDWGSYFDPAARSKGLRLKIADYRRPDPRTITLENPHAHASASDTTPMSTLRCLKIRFSLSRASISSSRLRNGSQNASISSISACGRSWCTPPGRK